MPKVKKVKIEKGEVNSAADKFLVSLKLLEAMDAIKPEKIIGRAMLKVSKEREVWKLKQLRA